MKSVSVIKSCMLTNAPERIDMKIHVHLDLNERMFDIRWMDVEQNCVPRDICITKFSALIRPQKVNSGLTLVYPEHMGASEVDTSVSS